MRTRRRLPRALSATAFLVTFLTALAADSSAADMVKLDNGDVITGTVKRLSDGKLVVKTDYAGEISIESEHVTAVSTEKPFTVRWDDGSEKVGRMVITSGGQMDLVDSATPVAPTTVAAAPNEPTEAEPEEAPDGLVHDLESAETEAANVLAEAEPADAPSAELAEAKEAAAEATAAAIEYADEVGERPVAAEAGGAINMSTVAWIKPITPFYRYEGSFNVGINAARGNTDTTDVHIDGKLTPSFGRNTVSIGGFYNKSEADGVVNKSNWTIRAEYDRDFGIRRKWYGTVFNTYENDELADLTLRVTAGAGVGYRFFTERPTLLRISLGPAYVREDFTDALDRTFLSLRWNLNFEQDLWTEDLVFYHNDTMTFGLSEKQYVLRTTTGIKMDLIADFTLSAEFRYDYNGQPPPDTLKSDQYYVLKIGYEFRGDENDWFPQW